MVDGGGYQPPEIPDDALGCGCLIAYSPVIVVALGYGWLMSKVAQSGMMGRYFSFEWFSVAAVTTLIAFPVVLGAYSLLLSREWRKVVAGLAILLGGLLVIGIVAVVPPSKASDMGSCLSDAPRAGPSFARPTAWIEAMEDLGISWSGYSCEGDSDVYGRNSGTLIGTGDSGVHGAKLEFRVETVREGEGEDVAWLYYECTGPLDDESDTFVRDCLAPLDDAGIRRSGGEPEYLPIFDEHVDQVVEIGEDVDLKVDDGNSRWSSHVLIRPDRVRIHYEWTPEQFDQGG